MSLLASLFHHIAVLFYVAAAISAYVFMLRPLLRRRADLAPFFAEADTFWACAGRTLVSLRTILVARFLWLGGALVTVHDGLAQIVPADLDLQPIVPVVLAFIPAEFRGMALTLALALIGAVFEWLRRVTRGPVDAAPVAAAKG